MRTPTAADDEGSRALVLPKPGAKPSEKIPVRVDPDAELRNGDEVRLSVEVPSSGYLYVIDREKMKDGTWGPPTLIYPNFQTRRGDNVLAPGRVLEIPDRRDAPNVFVLESKAGQAAEVLSLLVTPEPIPGLKTADAPLELDPALYESWEKKWGVEAQRFAVVDDEGRVWTESEKQAGADRRTRLTADDPLPQTMYRLKAKPGSGMLVQVPLRIKP